LWNVVECCGMLWTVNVYLSNNDKRTTAMRLKLRSNSKRLKFYNLMNHFVHGNSPGRLNKLVQTAHEKMTVSILYQSISGSQQGRKNRVDSEQSQLDSGQSE
jgi:hypothetical protein